MRGREDREGPPNPNPSNNSPRPTSKPRSDVASDGYPLNAAESDGWVDEEEGPEVHMPAVNASSPEPCRSD